MKYAPDKNQFDQCARLLSQIANDKPIMKTPEEKGIFEILMRYKDVKPLDFITTQEREFPVGVVIKAMEEYAEEKVRIKEDQHNKELKEIRERIELMRRYGKDNGWEIVEKGSIITLEIIDKHIK